VEIKIKFATFRSNLKSMKFRYVVPSARGDNTKTEVWTLKLALYHIKEGSESCSTGYNAAEFVKFRGAPQQRTFQIKVERGGTRSPAVSRKIPQINLRLSKDELMPLQKDTITATVSIEDDIGVDEDEVTYIITNLDKSSKPPVQGKLECSPSNVGKKAICKFEITRKTLLEKFTEETKKDADFAIGGKYEFKVEAKDTDSTVNTNTAKKEFTLGCGPFEGKWGYCFDTSKRETCTSDSFIKKLDKKEDVIICSDAKQKCCLNKQT